MTEALDPVLIEVTRGNLVESNHRGAIAVARADGGLVLALGDVARPIFPRSAIKALQAIPVIESGAADAFGFGDKELAVICASHSGDAVHIAAVRSILAKAGVNESALACGAHWPIGERAPRDLIRAGKTPTTIHNNCSGKHAGMLATAVHRGLDPRGYELPEHAVQQEIARAMAESCGYDLSEAEMGIDGCSVPAYALPLAALATGFARFATGKGLTLSRAATAQRLIRACFAEPVLVAGGGRFDTMVMRALPGRIFVKGGAEGVHCAAIPELELGMALKIDDGAKRSVETALAHLLAVLVPGASEPLSDLLAGDIRNWRGRKVGEIRASPVLANALTALAILPGQLTHQPATLA